MVRRGGEESNNEKQVRSTPPTMGHLSLSRPFPGPEAKSKNAPTPLLRGSRSPCIRLFPESLNEQST